MPLDEIGFLVPLRHGGVGAVTTSVQQPESKSRTKEPLAGYVYCSDPQGERFTSMLLDICRKLPAGGISCGQRISVIGRRGGWLELAFPDKVLRYLPINRASQTSDKFVPFETDSGLTDGGSIECPTPKEPQVREPRAIYAPDPEYSDKARKLKISGTVQMSLIVGVDGVPRDVKIEKSLGYGLDENALEAVRKWKFQPAMKDGKPIEKEIHVTTEFDLY